MLINQTGSIVYYTNFSEFVPANNKKYLKESLLFLMTFESMLTNCKLALFSDSKLSIQP